MWLPKDERRLLAGYYNVIGGLGRRNVYRIGALRPLLRCYQSRSKVPEYGDAAEPAHDHGTSQKGMKEWVNKHFDETNRIELANKHLHERGLIVLELHENEHDVVLISLTVDGYDVGRKYAGFLTRSGLWFEEYRNHWLWLIIAFFGGAIGVKLVDVLGRWVGSVGQD